MKTVKVFVDWFHPAFRAGGPVVSLYNLTRGLDKFKFEVYTESCDADGTELDVPVNRPVGISENCNVIYFRGRIRAMFAMFRTIRKAGAGDVIYLNSMYSRMFTIIPLLFCQVTGTKARVVIAPRGMLHAGALDIKPRRKKFFLAIVRYLPVVRRAIFQATSDQEAEVLRASVFQRHVLYNAPNIPRSPLSAVTPIVKNPGSLDLLFFGRIVPIKNLDFVLRCLREVQGNLSLTIVGPKEDQAYWQVCRNLIADLEGRCVVNVLPALIHEKVEIEIGRHHCTFLPSISENFGHTMYESLACGRPVITSDRTAWRNLGEQFAGRDIALDRKDLFVEALKSFLAMDQKTWNRWSECALGCARQYYRTMDAERSYSQLFGS